MLQDVTAIITSIGVVFAALSIRANQRQRLRQFEAFYVKRYWTLMDGLSLDALKDDSSKGLHARDEKVIRAYIRLCEDECELREKGWIADATWSIWLDGMSAQFSRSPFDAVWKRVKKDESQYKLLRLLEKSGWSSRAVRPSIGTRLRAGLVGTTGV